MAFVSMLIHNHSSHYLGSFPLSCGFTRCVPYYHDITLSIICQHLRGICFLSIKQGFHALSLFDIINDIT